MKKFAFYFIILLMLISSTSFASQAREGAAKAIDVSAPGVFPIVKERVNLRFMWVKTAGISDIATNLLTLHMEEMTNVHILWDMVQGNEAVRISLVNGDLPDAIWGNASITAAEEQKFGAEGIFDPLDSLIEKHAVPLITSFADESTVRFITGDRDLAEWDSYLGELDRLGLKRSLQIYQESCDKKYR